MYTKTHEIMLAGEIRKLSKRIETLECYIDQLNARLVEKTDKVWIKMANSNNPDDQLLKIEILAEGLKEFVRENITKVYDKLRELEKNIKSISKNETR